MRFYFGIKRPAFTNADFFQQHSSITGGKATKMSGQFLPKAFDQW